MEAEDLKIQADVIPISLHRFFEKDRIAQAETCRDFILETLAAEKEGRRSDITALLFEHLKRQKEDLGRNFISGRIRLLKLHEYLQGLVAGGYIIMDQAKTMCRRDFLEKEVQDFLVAELEKIIDLDSGPDPTSISGKVYSIIAEANKIAMRIKAEKDEHKPQFAPRDDVLIPIDKPKPKPKPESKPKLKPKPKREPESKPKPKAEPKPKPKSEPKPKMKPKEKESNLDFALQEQCASVGRSAMRFSTTIIILLRGCSDEDKDKMKQLAIESGGELIPKVQYAKQIISSLITYIQNKTDISELDIKEVNRPDEEFDIEELQISTQCKRIKRSAEALVRCASTLKSKITAVNAKDVATEANLYTELQEVMLSIQCLEDVIAKSR